MTRLQVLLALVLSATADSSEPATASSGTDQLRGVQATSNSTIRLKSKPELCLKAGYGDLRSYDKIHLFPCSAAANQQFEMYSDYTIRVKSKPEMCFNVNGGNIMEKYNLIKLSTCTAAPNEQFWIGADGTIRVKSKPEMCFNAKTRTIGHGKRETRDTGKPGDLKEGDLIQLWTCSAAANEQFLFANAQFPIAIKAENLPGYELQSKPTAIKAEQLPGYELQSKWNMCGDRRLTDAAGAADCASKCDTRGQPGQGDWECEGFGFKGTECLLYKDSTKCGDVADYAWYKYKKKGCQWYLDAQMNERDQSEIRERDCNMIGQVNEASRGLARIHAYTFFAVLFVVFARR